MAAGGQRVALIERVHLGGSRVNFGCTPGQAFIASARLAHQAWHGDRWGLRIPTVAVDFGAVMDRARGSAADAVASLDRSFAAHGAPRVITGHGRLAGHDGEWLRVEVADRSGTAEMIRPATSCSIPAPGR